MIATIDSARTDRKFRFLTTVALVVAMNCVSSISRRKSDPGIWVDERADEPNGAVAKQNVAAWRAMFTPHFVRMSERIIGGMNNDLWMVVNVGAAVHAYQTSAAVAVGRPR